MKTHDLSRALNLLARMLKASPNVELKDWPGPEKTKRNPSTDESNAADAGLALNVLLGLSSYTKGQWRSLIEEWGLEVPILQSDSRRDLVGRLLIYLGKNPDVAKRIKEASNKKSTKASPELSKVLSILLGEDNPDKKDDKK